MAAPDQAGSRQGSLGLSVFPASAAGPSRAGRGLDLRARCARPASVRIFLWEGDKDIGYISADPIIPADGMWHVGRVPFRDLFPSTANTPDPNGRLDLGQVRRISLGMNYAVNENTLEVSDLYVVTGEPGPTRAEMMIQSWPLFFAAAAPELLCKDPRVSDFDLSSCLEAGMASTTTGNSQSTQSPASLDGAAVPP